MDKKKLVVHSLEYYRDNILFPLHHQPRKGLLHQGDFCCINDPEMELTHGDVVHPCVRYIEEGFEGHRWWMVYTPYYAGCESLENPRLCYSDSEENKAPTNWKIYCIITDRPKRGYNSDPTLHYNKGKLYVFWREVGTPNASHQGFTYATYGCYVQNGTVYKLQNHLLGDDNKDSDRECCPTIINDNGIYRAYAMHLLFTPKLVYKLPKIIASFMYRHKIWDVLSALGVYDIPKSLGIAIWEGESLEHPFRYVKSLRFQNQSRLFQPWHMEIFSVQGDDRIYAVVQTNISFAHICLAWSDDGENFHLARKPLVSRSSIGMSGIYKPSALVVGERFYLYYTARDKNDNNLNRLLVTSAYWRDIVSFVNN